MESPKRQSHNNKCVFVNPKTKSAEQSCQSTALTTAVFNFTFKISNLTTWVTDFYFLKLISYI